MALQADLVIRGGTVVDGTGCAPFSADVAVLGDAISTITRPAETLADLPVAHSVDATGLVVTPGFVDMHTHSDVSLISTPAAASKVVQGVTTEVVGNCGYSAFPASEGRVRSLEELLDGLGTGALPVRWRDLDGYAAAIEAARPVTNLVPLVGHGALRVAAAGTADVPVTEDLLRRLRRLLRIALEQGAFGLSTGLTYVPSRFAGPEEVHALAAEVAHRDGLYVTHARAWAGSGFAQVTEALDVGRTTGVKVQYSHAALNDPRLWGRAGDVLALFQCAREEGVDAGFDVYPYDASASALTQYLPGWLLEDGVPGLVRRLGRRADRARARHELAAGLFGGIPWDWDRVLLSQTGPGTRHLEGHSVRQAAAEEQRTPEDLVLDLCARYGHRVQVVLFYRDERDVRVFLASPLAIVGSDGSSMPLDAPGHPHPRNFGAHARLLERYVLAHGLLSLVEAVHKCTGAPAERLGLADRGRVEVGCRADLAIFNPRQVRETATWTRPRQLAAGMRHVLVNGVPVVADGRLTGARPGRLLRRTR
jgi:N-acyl-D-aspartate/D-glutamate deacylase